MVRVRFAPGPTGHLHIGGARTALFNWLYASGNRGKFILRIEDTDVKRSSTQSAQSILRDLRWLGLLWDEGPYFQSERTDLYQTYANQLLKGGWAYECFCLPHEIDNQRKTVISGESAYLYDGHCRELSLRERKQYLNEGRKPALRFKVPDGITRFYDLIRGGISFENRLIGDFIIMRTNGIPTYNFACAVDDALMKITHVIRGEDHISNTPLQIMIYSPMGFELPHFCHLPLIVGGDRKPLSKRHGVVSIDYYRKEGYLPEAIVNYLALLGWATSDSQQKISPNELVKNFSLKRVSKNAAVFDTEKLKWLNSTYLKELSAEVLLKFCLPYLKKAYPFTVKSIDYDQLLGIIKLFHTRLKTTADIILQAEFFFKDDILIQSEAKKLIEPSYVKELLFEIKKQLMEIEEFSEIQLESVIRKMALQRGISAAEIIHPLRAVITGKKVSPSLFACLSLLGKERVIKRIESCVTM